MRCAKPLRRHATRRLLMGGEDSPLWCEGLCPDGPNPGMAVVLGCSLEVEVSEAGAGADAEPGVDLGEVRLDGFDTDDELAGDVLIRVAFRGERGDCLLVWLELTRLRGHSDLGLSAREGVPGGASVEVSGGVPGVRGGDVRETGKPIVHVARDLGVSETTLGNWVHADAGAAGSSPMTRSVRPSRRSWCGCGGRTRSCGGRTRSCGWRRRS